MAKHPARWVAGLGAAAGLAWWAANRFIPVKVEGPSMLPTLRPGDRLIVDTKGRVRPGLIVVVRAGDGPEIVKRAATVTQDGRIFVIGDNASASTDSRSIGFIPRDAVVGVARWNVSRRPYAMRGRSGGGTAGTLTSRQRKETR